LAAELAGLHIKGQAVLETYEVLATWADVVVVEGVGGLAVRLGPSLAVHDIVRRLALPLILAIHPDAHAPERAICAKGFANRVGVRIAGWIATDVGCSVGDSISALTTVMGGSAIAELPASAVSGQAAVKHVDLARLRGALSID
jgi:dethiobiotin synthetase